MSRAAAAGKGRNALYKSMPIGLLLGLFLISIAGVHFSSAQASSSITCNTLEGASPVTLSLTEMGNATVSPASLVCNGTPVSVTVSVPAKLGGSVWAAVQPATAAYTRAIFAGDAQSEQIATCTSGTCTFDTTQLSVYSQVEEAFTFTISGGGTGYAPPTLSYTSEGTHESSPVGTDVWMDCCDTTWSVASTLGGSTVSEQWAAYPGDVQGVVTASVAGDTNTITYYNQFSLTASFSVTGGSGYDSPQLTYTEYGNPQSTSPSINPTPYWADAGTTWSISSSLYGASNSERWIVPQGSIDTGTVSEATTISPLYQQQYLITAMYTIIGNGSSGYSNPTIFYTSRGLGDSATLRMSPEKYWMDADTQWNVTNALGGNSTTQRWETDLPTSGFVSSGGNVTIAYYWQYLVTFRYSVVGGGENYTPPVVNYTQFGVVKSGSLGSQVWADVGSSCSYTNPLVGSTSTERWSTKLSTPIISSNTTSVTYFHQFAYSLNYTIMGQGRGYSNPILRYTSFGTSSRTLLTNSPSVYWMDSGTSWRTNFQLSGSSASERWATAQATDGIATTSDQIDFDYFNQYALSLDYTIMLGGSPPAPMLNYTVFGMPNSTALNETPTSYWVDADSSWLLTKSLQLPSTATSERWVTNATTTVDSVSGVFNQTAVYVHQYYLLDQLNDVRGGSLSTAAGWYNARNNISIAATANPGWEFVSWAGSGARSYSGPTNNETVSMMGPVNETAIFDAALKIVSGPSGSVEYNYANQSGTQTGIIRPGSNATIFVLPYTAVNLTASPSSVIYIFHDWSGAAIGNNISTLVNVSTPKEVGASFGLDYTDITVFVIVTTAVIALCFAAFPVSFKIRAIAPRKKQSPSRISGKV